MLIKIKSKEAAAATDVCCPVFDPGEWNNILHQWTEKRFVKDTIPEIFHIPLPGTYRKAISRMWSKAQRAGAAPAPDDFLLLAHDPSACKGELYMAVTRDVPGADTVKLSGNFFSKVFEGTYGDVPRCLKEMKEHLASSNLFSKKDYIYFPYCPKCAKKYGHNYIVVVAEV